MSKKRSARTAALLLAAITLLSGCGNVSNEMTDTDFDSIENTETVSVSEDDLATSAETETSAVPDPFGPEGLTLPNTDFLEMLTGDDSVTGEDGVTGDETGESLDETDISEETSETTVSRSWSETNITGTMYVVADCVGRQEAKDDSTIVTKFEKGQVVELLALTDSGFYKVKGGGYVHPEYLSDDPVTESETTLEETEDTEETTVTTKRKKKQTTTASTEEETLPETEEVTEPVSVGSEDFTLPVGKYKERYAYNQLTKAEQRLYADIFDAVNSFTDFVQIEDGISRTDAIKVYMMVFNEEPQLFWMGSTVSVNGGIITINYKVSEKEAKKMQQEIETAAAPVLAKINAAGSVYEKLKVMYDYVILNNDAEVSSDGFNATMYNAFTDGNIQCAGYAKCIQYLCDLSGIESTVIVGRNAQNGSHAWNVVKCGDGYYNFDSTWGDPINEFDSKYIRHTYFLVPDSDIHNISHFDVNCFFLSDGTKIKCFDPPKCTKTKYNYYMREGLYFTDTTSADAALKAAIERAVSGGENAVQIRVSDEKIFAELTNGTAAGAYLKYAKSLSPKVSGIQKFTTDTYKKTGVVTYDIKYK